MARLPETTEVLIVGAGPTGLACALSLYKEGCRDITVVDAVEHGQNSSRALAIHAATLEVLDGIGCAQSLIEAGATHRTMKVWNVGDDRFVNLADFGPLKSSTRYPFVLIIPQTVTERVLGEHVRSTGVPVLRPFNVVGMQANRHDKTYTSVFFEGGQSVKARYVIGCDGAKSAIRQAAGVDFTDPEETHSEVDHNLDQIVLGDVTYTEPLSRLFDDPIFILSPTNLFLSVPFPYGRDDVSRTYRIVCGVPPSKGTPPSQPGKAFLQDLVAQSGMNAASRLDSGPSHVTIAEVIWSSRFRTHSSIADTFFKRLEGGQGGPVIFIGDAAHIHPPAGGQGMNLGLRDAISLGPILAARLRSSTVDDLQLRTWADGRRQQGVTIIQLTKTILGLASVQNGGIVWMWNVVPLPILRSTVRSWSLWVLGKSTWLQSKVAWRLSGLGNL